MAERNADLTVVIPVEGSGVADAVARAYEHLVSMDLVTPCLWVTGSEDGTPVAVRLDAEQGAVSEPTVPPRSLLEIVASSSSSRIRVVALALPGDVRSGSDADLADQVARAFSVFEGADMDISYLSLLVPTLDSPPGSEAQASVESALVRSVPWENVLVAPEDRQDEGAMAMPVRCGPAFPFHAASAIATLTAAWTGMDEDPLDQMRRESPESLRSPAESRVIVARSRSRSVIAPSTADAVPGAVFARRQTWPVVNGAVQARMPTAAIETVGRHFFTGVGGPLTYARPTPPDLPAQQPLTIAALFRLLRDWLTRRLPSIVADDIRRRVVSATDGIEDWVSDRVLGQSSAFRLDRRGRLAAEAAQVAADAFVQQIEMDFGSELISRTPPAEPQVWRSLRSLTFALVDGGVLPPELSSSLVDGGKRTVVTSPSDLVPSPDSDGWWQPSMAVGELIGIGGDQSLRICDVWTARRCAEALEALAVERSAAAASEMSSDQGATFPPPPLSTLPPPPPSPASTATDEGEDDVSTPDDLELELESVDDAGDEERRKGLAALEVADIASEAAALDAAMARQSGSLLWRVAQTTADGMDAAVADYRRLLGIIANPPGDELVERLKREAKSSRRRLLLRLVVVLVLVWVVARVLPNIQADSRLVRIAVVVGALVVASLLVKGVVRYIRDRFRRDHELASAMGEYEYACESITPVLIEVSRLHHVYQQLLDWTEILAVILHRPFGPPVAVRGRMHGSWVGDLQAHQIGEGEISADTLTGLVAGQQERVFAPGWLGATYTKAQDDVLGRYRNLTQQSAEAADPDADNSTVRFVDPIQNQAPRQFLRNELDHGQPLRELRLEEMDEVLTQLSELPPGRLCDSVLGRPPSEWLLDAVPRETPAEFPRTIWTEAGLMKVGQAVVANRAVWAPPELGARGPEGVSMHSARPNGSVLASSVVCVDLSNPVRLDYIALIGEHPTAPVERIPLPPAPEARMERAWVSFGNVGPDESLLPEEGTVYSPSERPARPGGRGSYAFMSIVDGRPSRFPLDEPIEFRVRAGIGPEDAYALVTRSIQAIADASGHSFRFAGTFDRLSEMDPGQGGIWIAFAEPNDRGPDGNVILGHGGVIADGELIVGGQAIIGNDAEAQPGFGPGHTIGSVVLHELCHAMNLAHVEVQSELMFPYVNSLTPPLFGPGDEMGLWLVGVGRGARS